METALIPGCSAGVPDDLVSLRNKISVLRPNAMQPRSEDEHMLDFAYGPDAQPADVHERSLLPLLRKLVEGYNTAAILFGASGMQWQVLPAGRGTCQQPLAGGFMHLASESLFELLGAKQAAIGQRVTSRRRAFQAKGYEFYLECSAVEVHSEACRDLLVTGSLHQPRLAVSNDALEGWHVAGLSARSASTPVEMHGLLASAYVARDRSHADLGAMDEHSAVVLKVRLAQFVPATEDQDEDSAVVSSLLLVDMPGAEKLLVDPEVLRLHEGSQLSKSLLAWAAQLRRSAGQPGVLQHAGYEDTVLTRLLAETLGGNCLTTVIGTLRQGEWDRSLVTLKHLLSAQRVVNFPVVNHGRVRGLLGKLRGRVLHLQAERGALQEQLARLPEFGEGNGLLAAQSQDLQRQFSRRQDEIDAENMALADKLERAVQAATVDAAEKKSLQDQLITSEEQRLEVSQVLLDFQLEHNHAKEDFENQKYALEQHILQLEAKQVADGMRLAEAADKDAAVGRLLEVRGEAEAAKAGQERAEQHARELQGNVDDLRRQVIQLEAVTDAAGRRVQQLEARARQQEQHIQELHADSHELHAQADAARREAAIAHKQLRESRAAFKARTEHFALEVGDLHRAVQLAASDPGSDLAPSHADFADRVKQLVEQLHQVQAQKDADAAHALREAQQQHSLMRGQMQALHDGYRRLRHRVEDQEDHEPVMPEEQLLGGSLAEQLAADDAVQQQAMEEMRDRVSKLEREMVSQALKGLASDSKAGKQALRRITSREEPEALPYSNSYRVEALEADNRRLHLQLQQLRQQSRAQAGLDAVAPRSARRNARTPLSRRTDAAHVSDDGRDGWGKKEGTSRSRHHLRDNSSPQGWEKGTTQAYSQPAWQELEVEAQHLRHECKRLQQRVDQLKEELRQQPPSHSRGLGALEIENERLRSELDTLRHHATATPTVRLRELNERQRDCANSSVKRAARLRELEQADKTRSQMGYEIAELKVELDRARRAGDDGKGGLTGLRRQVKEFTLNTQLDLERQLASMQARAVAAEEQLQALQHYIAQATLAYQKEIVRLRRVVDVVDGRPSQQAWQQVQQPDMKAKDRGQQPRQQQQQLARSSSSDGSTKAAAAVRQQLRPLLVRSASNRSPVNANPVIDAWQKS
eukprot:jgi/Astpho2/6625/Aster-x1385